MANTTFINNVTLTDAAWFNDVNDLAYEGTVPTTATWRPSSANRLIYSSAAGQLTSLAPTNTAYLTSDASGVPQWTAGIPAPTTTT